ncbi:MAG TPA: hypothetical protein VKE70_18060 [Candidatus Solibacter sp.]|nr:hypothetical protein [Candidatus Solibacter sp.]
MPLQNRVDPYGTIIHTPARGTIMGNRGGAIHNDRREIVRPFVSRRWITCVLEFKNRHREVMGPGRYTELFFLDEAVSLAAGHRPCAECRRERYNAFRTAWAKAHGGPLPSADEMDLALHPARIDSDRGKVTWRAPLESLPDGCFVELDGSPYLIQDDALLLWMPERYSRKARRAPMHVSVLTPRPTVECLRRGYIAEVHPSANVL